MTSGLREYSSLQELFVYSASRSSPALPDSGHDNNGAREQAGHKDSESKEYGELSELTPVLRFVILKRKSCGDSLGSFLVAPSGPCCKPQGGVGAFRALKSTYVKSIPFFRPPFLRPATIPRGWSVLLGPHFVWMGANRLFHHFGASTFADTSCRLPETALISIYCLPEDLAILWKVESRWFALLRLLSPPASFRLPPLSRKTWKGEHFAQDEQKRHSDASNRGLWSFYTEKITSKLDQITTVGRCSKSLSKAEGSVGLPERNYTGEYEIINLKFYIVISLFFCG